MTDDYVLETVTEPSDGRSETRGFFVFLAAGDRGTNRRRPTVPTTEESVAGPSPKAAPNSDGAWQVQAFDDRGDR